MKKRLFVSLMVIILTIVILPCSLEEVYAGSESASFTGSTCTKNVYGAASIDYLLGRYKHLNKFDGPGQCWGYAEKVNELLAEESNTRYYNGLRFTKSNFIEKCLNTKAGTHIRFSHGSTFNGGYGHSVVLLKVTNKQVIWADNNYYGSNIVSYYKGTMNDFIDCYGQYEYINMISKTSEYQAYKSPKLSARAFHSSGKIKLAWLAVKDAEVYEVYRRYSQNDNFVKITEVTDTNYADDTVKPGVTAYYKVKAITEDETKSSGVVSSKLKIEA